jgi:hypothetical protein
VPALTLPDLGSLTGGRDGVLGALGEIAAALPADPGSITAGLTGGTENLHASLEIDLTGLTGGLSNAIEALADAVPAGVPELDALGPAFGQALGLVEPLRQALTSNGQVLDLKSLAFEQAGDPAQRIQDLLGDLTNLIPAEGVEALETFVSTITAFEASIPTDPAQVATFLGRAFLGVPADLLAPAKATLDGFVGGIGALVPQGQVAGIATAVAGIEAELTALEAHVRAIDPGVPASYTVSLTALGTLQAHLQALGNAVSGLAASFTAGLPVLDVSGFLSALESVLAAIPEVRAPDTGEFLEIVIEPFRRVSALADTITPEEVAAQIRGWSHFIDEEVGAQGLDTLEAIIRKPFEDIGHAIEGLHLEAIREAFRAALGEVGSALGVVTGAIDSVRSELVGGLDGAATAVGAVTSAAAEVEDGLQTLATAVQSAAGAVDLQGFHDQALALVQELSTGVGDFVGTAGAGVGKLHDLVGELESVDLQGATAGAVDAIGRITATLDSIDVALLPDALLSELKAGLTSLLDSISLEPVHETLTQVIEAVPFDELDQFTAAFEDILQELEGFSPSALIEPLVAPFDGIVGKLNELHPGELLDPVIAGLEEARTALDALSPAQLLAPLDAPLAQVRTALESVAPERLLAPLHPPFAELMGLVEKLNATELLDELDTLMFGWMEQGLSGLSGLGGSLSGATSTHAILDAISGTGPGGAEFGFRPGDVLRPVQELYEKIVSLLDAVPEATLIAAFEHLRAELVETLDALSPGNLHAHLHQHVEGVVGAFDLAGNAELLGDMLPRYAQLTVAVGAIDPAAAGGAEGQHHQLVTLTAAVDPEVVIGPLRPALRTVRSSGFALATSLELGGVAGNYRTVARRLSDVLPEFLREPLTIESLRAHLDALNPKHLADEVNAEFEALALKLARFAEVFVAELPKVTDTLKGRAEHVLDGLLRGAFAAVYDPLKAQLQTLDPAGLEADLNHEVYDPIRAALAKLSLAGVVGDSALTAKLDGARTTLAGAIASLRSLQTSLAGGYEAAVHDVLLVSPQTLSADLQTAYAPVAEALASLDLTGLSGELHAQFLRIGEEAADVLQQVLEALKAMVAAIPSGVEGVNVEVDFSVRA